MSTYRVKSQQHSTPFLFSTVRLEGIDAAGDISLGTAFFFDSAPAASVAKKVYLVTNKHVLEGSESVRARFHIGPSTRNSGYYSAGEERWISFDQPSKLWIGHPDPEVDLCAAPVVALQEASADFVDPFFTSLSASHVASSEEMSSFPAIMQVMMIGYPTGLWDETNNLPLIRRGTTASHPGIDFDGRPEVVIDMACFPGSSGSPVLFHDRQYFASAVRFLGILYAGPTVSLEGAVSLRTIPTRAGPSARIESMMHLGNVIKAEKLVELAAFIEAAGA